MDSNNKKNNVLKYSIITLAVVVVLGVLYVFKGYYIIEKFKKEELIRPNELIVFIQDNCLYCKHAEEFLAQNAEKYKDVKVAFFNLGNRESQTLLFKYLDELNIPKKNLGTPIFISKDQYIVGFGENEKIKLIQLLDGKKITDNTEQNGKSRK